jgi:hypothetical protein
LRRRHCVVAIDVVSRRAIAIVIVVAARRHSCRRRYVIRWRSAARGTSSYKIKNELLSL